MAKVKKTKNQAAPESAPAIPEKSNKTAEMPENKQLTWISMLIITVFCALIYSNISDHQFVLDDLPTIQGNAFVQQGFKGFGDIMTTRAWDGYNKAINIAAYRPMQLLLYATEFQFVGQADAGISHVVNVFYYIFLNIMLFLSMRLMLGKKYYGLPLMITLLFAAHPLHSEVVSNLKSRDELLTLMFAITALYFTLRYYDSRKIWQIAMGAFMYFCALLSKETAVVFMGAIPMSLYFFRKASIKDMAKIMMPLAGVFVLFFLIRMKVFEMAGGQSFQHTYLQNPILGAKGASEVNGTKFWVLGKYLQLLVYPYEMTFTYFFDGIPLTKMSDWKALLAFAIHIGMLIYGLRGLKTRNVISYAFLYYLGAIALFSNFIVQIGDAMGERLAFTPSLGFCIAAAWVFRHFMQKDGEDEKEILKANFTKIPHVIATALFIIVLGVYGLMAHNRNMAWHDNFALCTTDVKTSPESYILNRQLALTYLSFTDTVAYNQKEHLDTALYYFRHAVRLDPNNPALWKKFAEGYTKNNQIDSALYCYKISIAKAPSDAESIVRYSELCRRTGQFALAISTLAPMASQPYFSSSYHCNRELGLNYYYSQKYAEAETFLTRSLQTVDSDHNKSIICSDLGSLYYTLARLDLSQQYFLQAVQLNPNYDVPLNGYGVTLFNQQKFAEAVEYFVKAAAVNPQNMEATGNAANSYAQLGNQAKAQEYSAKYQQLLAARQAAAGK